MSGIEDSEIINLSIGSEFLKALSCTRFYVTRTTVQAAPPNFSSQYKSAYATVELWVGHINVLNSDMQWKHDD